MAPRGQLVARSRLSLRATDRWFEALPLRGCLSLFGPLPVTTGDSGRQRPSALRIRALAASPRRRSGLSAPLSANHDLFYGKDGGLAGSDRESQEVSMLALHLLQSALAHVSTLLLQDILGEEKCRNGSPPPTGGPCPSCTGST